MYLFYLDESGEREYESRSRYFVLCALGIPISQWRLLNRDLLTLKKTYFTRVDVEIKSSWFRNPYERQKHYLSQYQISETELHEFIENVYEAMLSYDVVLIASIIDKNQTREKYTVSSSPSSLAYRLLFEGVELFLKEQQPQSHGILIFDVTTYLLISPKMW